MKSSAPVAKYLFEFKKKYKKKGKKVVEILVQKLEAGEDVEQAIRETIEVTYFQDMLDQDTKNAIAASTAAGMGRSSIPLLPEMETPWDPSELSLSEKLHSIHREIHQKIGNIVQQQVRLHNHASDIRKALYDGYNGQKTEAVLQQELPQYIKGAVDFIRRTPFEKTDKECRLRLIRRIERQAKALTSKPLKTAYKELAIQLGKNNEDGLKRAVYVAVQEKSRYVAERIARTESARAWADGFIARYENDDTVAAYRWEVSSAHPCTDVCDMYANADLWGLGKGIYPKDQCPTLPAHPHCLCYLSPIYEGEVDLNEQQDLREEGGNHWLQKQSKDVQRQLLGVQGAKAWEAGRPWQDVLRNYSPAVMKSRVNVVLKEQTKAAKNGKIEEKKLPIADWENMKTFNSYELKQSRLYFEKSVDDWNKHLSSDEVKAVNAYTGDDYLFINGYLRKNRDLDAQTIKTVKSQIKLIDEALSKFEVKDYVRLYRGCPRKDKITKDMIGSIIQDPAYQSATTLYAQAAEFAESKGYGEKEHIFEICMPPGKGRGAYVCSISEIQSESEFLIARGTKFKIVDVNEGYGIVNVKLEVLKDE